MFSIRAIRITKAQVCVRQPFQNNMLLSIKLCFFLLPYRNHLSSAFINVNKRSYCCLPHRYQYCHQGSKCCNSAMKRFIHTNSGVIQIERKVFNTPPVHPTTIDSNAVIESFNPLGPPKHLQKLNIHETLTISQHSFFSNHYNNDKKVTVKRLSKEPDIFLLENFVTDDNIRSMLMEGALRQGLKVAGTKNSTDNSVRKNSYLTWIEMMNNCNHDKDNNDVQKEEEEIVRCIAHDMSMFVAKTFIHEVMDADYFTIEDLQIAKYDKGGCFNEHHDGFGRFVTVLTYLNGVGGTFFPFAKTTNVDDTNDGDVRLLQMRDGLLVIGKEGIESYVSNGHSTEETRSKITPSTIVNIKEGDAIVFYNYNVGERDLRAVHESLTVPCEKWIATNWIRSESLTGFHSHLYLERLLDKMVA